MSSSRRNGRHRTTIREEPPVTGAFLAGQTRAFERHLPAALAGDPKAVHRARVASRRLREALPVMAAASKGRRKAGRKIRRVTRALGLVRELDVAISILDELARRPEIQQDALEEVRRQVVSERDLRRARMVERLTRVSLAGLGRRLEEIAGALPNADARDWRESLARRLGRRAGRLSSAIAAAGQMYAPESLHNVRIAAKKLRYALELAGDAGMPAGPFVATLKRGQDILGRLHDLQTIQGHVASVQALPPARAGASDEGLDLITRVLEKECRHLHARYIKAVPALLALAAECRTPMFASPSGPSDRRPPIKVSAARRGRVAVDRRA